MGDIQDYKIADHFIRLEGKELVRLVGSIEGFGPFTVNKVSQVPVLVIHQATVDESSPKMLEELYSFSSDDEVGLLSTFGTTAEGYTFQMSTADGMVMQAWCTKQAERTYVKGCMDMNQLSARAVRFIIWILFGISVAHLDTVAIHTSTITYQGKNVLFLGESGTGKSTHTRLWRDHIEGATLLNDDSPIVRILNGVPMVYGSPWSGKTPCYKNESYPLAACVRLSQAPYNRMKRLSVVESYAAIHPSCPPDFAYDDYLYDGISDTLDKVLSSVPFYHLECLPDAAAAQLSFETIFQ